MREGANANLQPVRLSAYRSVRPTGECVEEVRLAMVFEIIWTLSAIALSTRADNLIQWAITREWGPQVAPLGRSIGRVKC